MPDIKTAFEKALSQTQAHIAQPIPADWDDEGGAAVIETVTTEAKEATVPNHCFKTTNNVTRSTFNYVKNNPGNTRTQIVVALEAQGFNTRSTTSLVAQMIKQGHMRETNGVVFAAQPEYTPIKTTRNKKAKEKPTPAVKGRAQAKSRPKFVPAAEAPVQINAAWDAETLLNNLSIKQARSLYDELRKIFGDYHG